MNNRRFVIIAINSDCGSYRIAVRKETPKHWMFGPRCPDCQKPVGPMEWSIVGEVKAVSPQQALDKYEEQKRA